MSLQFLRAAAPGTATASWQPAMSRHAAGGRFAAVMAQASTEITLSTAARSQGSAVNMSGMPDWVRQTSQTLHENTDRYAAENLVHTFATVPDGELVDISSSRDGIHDVYYTANGAPVTDSSRKYFRAMSAAVLAGRRAIYEREAAAGTLPADIFDRMQVYMSRQPDIYLDMMNWHGKPAARAPRRG